MICALVAVDLLLLIRSLNCSVVVFLFFKQKTAYEMRISDWSSDVCSSDLPGAIVWLNTSRDLAKQKCPKEAAFLHQATERIYAGLLLKIGRASCRERVCQYV